MLLEVSLRHKVIRCPSVPPAPPQCSLRSHERGDHTAEVLGGCPQPDMHRWDMTTVAIP